MMFLGFSSLGLFGLLCFYKVVCSRLANHGVNTMLSLYSPHLSCLCELWKAPMLSLISTAF